MEVIETKAEGLKRAYEATATAQDIEAKIDAKIEEIRPTAQLKGFRKGKAPRDLLRKMFGPNMLGEVAQQMVDDALRSHLEKSEHKTAGQPEIKIVTEDFAPGKDLKVEFTYELMPDMPEIAFKEIELERLTVEVSEDEIAKSLENLASNAKSFETKEGAAENGDQVVIDFLGKVDGEAFEGGAADDFPLELGSGRFIPGFEEQLVGVSAGDERDVNVTFPEDYGAENLAGKAAVFSVTVKEVKGAQASAIDDELATKYGAENLDDLKNKLRENIGNQYRSASREHMKRKLLDALAERMSFDVPEGMLEGEAKTIAHDLWHEENPEVQGHDHPEIEPQDEHYDIAKRRVRLGLKLADIGSSNEIQVSDQEIASKVAEQAGRYPGQERQFYEFVMGNPQMKQQFAAPIFEDKVVDYIFELASVTERGVTADELQEELKKLEEEKK